MAGIYAIVNSKNGKRYIGCSLNISARVRRHVNALNKRVHHCHPLQSAWIKYGEGSFYPVIYEEVSDLSTLAIREKYWIDSQNSLAKRFGYNIKADAVWKCHDSDTKEKLSQMRRGVPKSAEARRRMSIAHTGKTLSEEHKKNISLSGMGRKHKSSSKEKIRVANTGRKFTNEHIIRLHVHAENQTIIPPVTREEIKKLYDMGYPPKKITVIVCCRKHHVSRVLMRLKRRGGNGAVVDP